MASSSTTTCNPIVSQALDMLDQAIAFTTMSDPTSQQKQVSGSPMSFVRLDGSSIVQFHDKRWSRPYPAIDRVGVVHSHDRPYAEYGSKDRLALSAELKFALPSKEDQAELDKIKESSARIQSSNFAISCWSTVAKETIMAAVLEKFTKERVKYVCVGNEECEGESVPRLHIQILLNKRINTTKSFLARCLNGGCQYQVTKRDSAWNEYIKKGLDFIEYQLFESSFQTSKIATWPNSKSSAGKKHQFSEEFVEEIYEKATKSVDDGLAHIVANHKDYALTSLARHERNLQTINRLARAEQRRKAVYEQEYCWPDSFDQCTKKLRDAMQQWVNDNFRHEGRPRCLILIGPTGTGKTTFAKSLYGVANHYRGIWSAKDWDSEANYMIFDDIPWDGFEKSRGFPDRRDLLTGQEGFYVRATQNSKIWINTKMPAIVLLNPDRAGSLLTQRIENGVLVDDPFWRERAFVYIMGPDEHFYRPNQTATNNNTNGPKPKHLQAIDEFRRNWQEARQPKRRRSCSNDDSSTDQQENNLQASQSNRPTLAPLSPTCLPLILDSTAMATTTATTTTTQHQQQTTVDRSFEYPLPNSPEKKKKTKKQIVDTSKPVEPENHRPARDRHRPKRFCE